MGSTASSSSSSSYRSNKSNMEKDESVPNGHENANGNETEIRATPEMCRHCFDVLLTTLHERHPHDPSLSSSSSLSSSLSPTLYVSPSVSCPLFVTWSKSNAQSSSSSSSSSSSNGLDYYDLRGCIGSLEGRRLHTELAEYARYAAFSDRRFSPILPHEVPRLRVGVSLLIRYEELPIHSHSNNTTTNRNNTTATLEDCYDWTVGVHGVVLKFRDHATGHRYNATYLPEVAKEQNWTQKQAIASLIRKAGYRGKVSSSHIQNICCTRYQSTKCTMTYAEYQDFLQLQKSNDDNRSA